MLPALARLTAAIGSMKCIAQCRASTCTATPFSGRHLSALRMRAPRGRRWRNCILPRAVIQRPRGARKSSLAALGFLPALIRNCPSLARLLARRRWRAAAHKRLLPFHARLYPLLQTLETLWTHNDWHASNLLWSSARAPVRVSAILDFGLSDRSYALCDLAIAIERNIIGWRAQPYVHSGSIDWDALHAFLDGYESLKPLTEAEAHALPRLLPLAHAEFALSEMAYFSSVADAPEQAALTYERYFLGHADWFNGCAGQALIACLERRAARANTAYALY